MFSHDVPPAWRDRLYDPGTMTAVVLGSIVLAFGLLLVIGGCFDTRLNIGAGVRRAQGEVVAINVTQGYKETHRTLTVRFLDGDGDARTFEQRADDVPDAVVGTKLAVAFHPDRERDFARLIGIGDDLIRWVLWGGGALLGLEGLIILLLPWLKARRRAFLIRQGRHMHVTVVGIAWHPLAFQGQRRWRVVGRWLEAETGTWYDAYSAWFASSGNVPGPVTGAEVLAFVHPRKPRKSWIPWPNRPLETATPGSSAPGRI